MRVSSPWLDEIPDAAAFARILLPAAQHVVSYHIVKEGGCWAAIRGRQPIRLEAGDVFVVPHGDPYNMASDPGLRDGMSGDAVLEFFRHMATQSGPLEVTEGGGGPKVSKVALDVGYQSEAAFSRAFKGSVGTSPAGWRRIGSRAAVSDR